ncbi:hypothetical protein [Chondromyces crocatus]|uniref:Uncharacterized protein n=1 Tax=Chondromyces crocatus TaxID=52 RepID=A0A0K1E5K1_CHOCO|nr:hypothetical protein [Chondromyces crocatus]AKT36114.1 uncharacterized protein CMC5_002270 [Chondromyces crocatus]
MSATWWIYSPLAPEAMRALEDECERVLEAYLEAHRDSEDEYAEVLASSKLPTLDELEALYRRSRKSIPASVTARFEACRSMMILERPGDLDVDAVQVSMLRFLLEKTGEALVLFNDGALETSEEVLRDLARKRGAADFLLEKPAAPARPPARRGVKATGDDASGEARAGRVEQMLSAARVNPELSIDVVEVLRKTPDLGRRYAALLIEEGAMSDASAAETLGVDRSEVGAVAAKLEVALRAVTG